MDALTPTSTRAGHIGTDADWPSNLGAADRAYLTARGVGPLIAARRGLWTAQSYTDIERLPVAPTRWGGTFQQKVGSKTVEVIGIEDHMAATGATAMVIPLYAPTANGVPSTHQIRLSVPRKRTDDKGHERTLKFEVPSRTGRGDEQGSLPADIHPDVVDDGDADGLDRGSGQGRCHLEPDDSRRSRPDSRVLHGRHDAVPRGWDGG